MKIRLLIQLGNCMPGDIYEALISNDKRAAIFYTDQAFNNYTQVVNFEHSSKSFEVVEDDNVTFSYTAQNQGEKVEVISLRELIGQDIARIEFK